MGKDVIEILEDKGAFIREVEAMLYADGNNMVDSLAYGVELQPGDDECCDEYVSVIYTDGLARRVLATGSSKREILKDILKEVYGWKIT